MGGLQTSSDRANDTNKEQRALIERILASSLFEKSARLSDFLKYICDRTLSGHPDEVHEQFIGHHVFDRPIDYNPADDNIVRVTARQLRAKLREYFQTEGRKERWLMEIPKGGYLPVFRERKPQAPTVIPARPDARTSSGLFLPKWGVTPIVMAAVGLLFLGVWGWKQARLATPPASQAPTPSPITEFFVGSPGPVRVVTSDSALMLMEVIVQRPFSLAQYEDRTYRDYPPQLAKYGLRRRFWALLSSRQISNIGDEEAGNRFLTSISAHGNAAAIRNARSMTSRDFMSGNFILLGGVYSDPWTQLFTKELNFQFAHGVIHDLKPAKGEKSMYPSEEGGDGNSLSYARIALVPNLTNTGRVLLVAGLGMESTEAASDFLLNPSSTRKIQRVLRTGNRSRLPGFELLLQTSTLAEAPETARIVASRVHRDSPTPQK